MSDIELNLQTRNDIGKGASRRLRRIADKVPAVLYGGESEAQSLEIEHTQILKAVKHDAFYSSILDLDVDGKKVKAVLKAIQRHPFKPKVIHLDFLRVSAKEAITMQVPIHLIGQDVSVGIKAGGLMQQLMNEVEIKCLPKDLPEHIDLDITELELDQTLHLSDLKIPTGVEFTVTIDESHNPGVVSISTPKVASAEEDEAPVGAEAAKGPEEEEEEEAGDEE